MIYVVCCHIPHVSLLEYFRKPSVVIKHSGLDESGESNGSDDFNVLENTNGRLDVTQLPKGKIGTVFDTNDIS